MKTYTAVVALQPYVTKWPDFFETLETKIGGIFLKDSSENQAPVGVACHLFTLFVDDVFRNSTDHATDLRAEYQQILISSYPSLYKPIIMPSTKKIFWTWQLIIWQ